MSGKRPLIHISGAYTAFGDGSRRASKRRRGALRTYELVAGLVREAGGEPYDPAHELDPGKPPSVTSAEDIEWLDAADGVVACMDEHSFGVGAEVMYALMHGKPVLGLARRGPPVSRLLEGHIASLRTPETGDLYEIFRYPKTDDLRDAVGPRVRRFVEAAAARGRA